MDRDTFIFRIEQYAEICIFTQILSDGKYISNQSSYLMHFLLQRENLYILIPKPRLGYIVAQ